MIKFFWLFKSGFIFVEWKKDGVKIEKIEKGTKGNLTLTAVWEEDAPPPITPPLKLSRM